MRENKIIAVVGGTGAQGGSVVSHLLQREKFQVRVLTRDPSSERAQGLAARGCELVQADLNDAASLRQAFDGAYGVFLVTNAWEPSGSDEYEQAVKAVDAAKRAGVRHLVWSTLPNCAALSQGRHEVRHFSEKARVDAEVTAAGFEFHTFVEAPMYFQNLLSPMMSPRPQPDGSAVWAFPMDVDAKGIYNGDITEFGKLVARVFEQPAHVGSGEYLAMTAGLLSWREIVDTLNDLGHDIRYVEQPKNEVDPSIPGAKEMSEMFSFWEEFTYFGPNAAEKIARANALVPEGFTSFAAWAKQNMQPSSSLGQVESFDK